MTPRNERQRSADEVSDEALFAWLDMSAANDRESVAMKKLLLAILSAAEEQCDRHEATMTAST